MIENPIIGQKYWTYLISSIGEADNEFGLVTEPWQGVLAPDDNYPYCLINPKNDKDYISLDVENIYASREEAMNADLETAMGEITALANEMEIWTKYTRKIIAGRHINCTLKTQSPDRPDSPIGLHRSTQHVRETGQVEG